MKRFLGYESAAEYLDVSVSYLKKKINDGTFKLNQHFYKPDGRRGIIRFDAVELEKWMQQKDMHETLQSPRSAVFDILSRVRPDP